MWHRRMVALAMGLSCILLGLDGALSEAEAQGGPQTELHALLPLGPVPPVGLPVAPFFEGWYRNPDGTYSLSFGHFNLNSQEVLSIPIGPDNFLEPAEFNGQQPTYFPVDPRRERGTFTVTLPSDWDRSQDVIWTLRSNGEELSVPARVGVPAYELHNGPMAAGSMPPVLRLEGENGEAMGITGTRPGPGPGGIGSGPFEVSVGEPLSLTAWVEDTRSQVREGTVGADRARELRLTWFTHQGPGPVEFSEAVQRLSGSGSVSTDATFSHAGEYVIRVRADNFSARDSSPGNQCCWTNGFVRVHVTP